MPMKKIRNRFLEENIIQGPATVSELVSILKYVIMHPILLEQRKKQKK